MPRHLFMFDIDGTLLQSSQFDAECFAAAVRDILGVDVDTDWSNYQYVSDTGILNELLAEYDESERPERFAEVKARFVERVQQYIVEYGVQIVPGASELLDALNRLPDTQLAVATGGWQETALMKCRAAGIPIDGIPMASSDDHFDRTEIMKISERRACESAIDSKTYFGDGQWDLTASKTLGYRFVAVGEHWTQNPTAEGLFLPDFSDHEKLVLRLMAGR